MRVCMLSHFSHVQLYDPVDWPQALLCISSPGRILDWPIYTISGGSLTQDQPTSLMPPVLYKQVLYLAPPGSPKLNISLFMFF